MLTVIDTRQEKSDLPGISRALEAAISRTLSDGKQSLLILNRLGYARSILCEDCHESARCQHCGAPLVMHSRPKAHARCHQCSYTGTLPQTCQSCGSHSLKGVGLAIDQVVDGLEKAFPDKQIVRVEAATLDEMSSAIEDADIIVATHALLDYSSDRLALMALLSVESELIGGSYDSEEKLYMHVRYALGQGIETFLQTSAPDAHIIRLIADGNLRDFTQYTLTERKKYGYPPYGEVAIVHLYDRKVELLAQKTVRLRDKLISLKSESVFVGFDSEYRQRRGELHLSQLFLKGTGVRTLLEGMRGELSRGRGVAVEWK